MPLSSARFVLDTSDDVRGLGSRETVRERDTRSLVGIITTQIAMRGDEPQCSLAV